MVQRGDLGVLHSGCATLSRQVEGSGPGETSLVFSTEANQHVAPPLQPRGRVRKAIQSAKGVLGVVGFCEANGLQLEGGGGGHEEAFIQNRTGFWESIGPLEKVRGTKNQVGREVRHSAHGQQPCIRRFGGSAQLGQRVAPRYVDRSCIHRNDVEVCQGFLGPVLEQRNLGVRKGGLVGIRPASSRLIDLSRCLIEPGLRR